MNLEQRIQVLDDRDAVRILMSFAQHQTDYRDQRTTPAWTQALANETGVSSISPVSEGSLARAALLVLADDPQHCEVPEALVSSPALQRYSGVNSFHPVDDSASIQENNHRSSSQASRSARR
jgi:hypothetical protein